MHYLGTHRRKKPLARRTLPRAAAALAIIGTTVVAPLAGTASAGINVPNPCTSVCAQLVNEIHIGLPNPPQVPDLSAVITAIEQCTSNQSTSSTNTSVNICQAVGSAIATINSVLNNAPNTVQQVATITLAFAEQTIASAVATYQQCADATNPTCALVLQTVGQTIVQLETLANQEVAFLEAYTTSCINGTNVTCNALIANVQNLVIEAEQEVAFVAATASACISGGNDTCEQLFNTINQRLTDIENVLVSAQQCVQGANGTACQSAEQAAGQVISTATTTLAGLVGQVETCASGEGPTCQGVINEERQLANTVQSAINGCVAQDPTSTCEIVISQVANALNYVEGTAISCSGIEADANCAALESATMPVLQVIGSQDVNASVVDVSGDANTGDVGYGIEGFGSAAAARTAVIPPLLPGGPTLGDLPATPLVWIDTFDTPADALAAGDLNAAATASNSKGGCATSNDGSTKPDRVYPPNPYVTRTKNIGIQYNDIAYEKDNAREQVDPATGIVGPTWQLNECLYGSARSYNHNNLWLSAASQADYYDPTKTAQIDSTWAVGTSMSNPSSAVNFKLTYKQLEVDAATQSHANGHNDGGDFNPPPYFTQKSDPVCVKSCTNEVAGWWQQKHAWYDPEWVWGSNQSQGTTLGGLWEFSQITQTTVTAEGSAYYDEYCYQTRGCH